MVNINVKPDHHVACATDRNVHTVFLIWKTLSHCLLCSPIFQSYYDCVAVDVLHAYRAITDTEVINVNEQSVRLPKHFTISLILMLKML